MQEQESSILSAADRDPIEPFMRSLRSFLELTNYWRAQHGFKRLVLALEVERQNGRVYLKRES